MGRYTGIVKNLPSRGSFGSIKSDSIAAPVSFDMGALNAAGGFVEGARVSFELDSGGKARSIKKSVSKNYNALTRRKKVVQSPG